MWLCNLGVDNYYWHNTGDYRPLLLPSTNILKTVIMCDDFRQWNSNGRPVLPIRLTLDINCQMRFINYVRLLLSPHPNLLFSLPGHPDIFGSTTQVPTNAAAGSKEANTSPDHPGVKTSPQSIQIRQEPKYPASHRVEARRQYFCYTSDRHG